MEMTGRGYQQIQERGSSDKEVNECSSGFQLLEACFPKREEPMEMPSEEVTVADLAISGLGTEGFAPQQFAFTCKSPELVFNLLRAIREDVGAFFNDNLRPRAEIGFAAIPLDPVSVKDLLDNLKAGSERLRLAIQNLSSSSLSAMLSDSSNEASKGISAFLRSLRIEGISDQVGENEQEGLFDNLLSLRAQLTGVVENWSLQKINREVSEDIQKIQNSVPGSKVSATQLEFFAAPGTALYQQLSLTRDYCFKKVAPVQQILLDLRETIKEVVDQLDSRKSLGFGFSSCCPDQGSVQINQLIQALVKASLSLERQYDDNLEDHTTKGVERRVMIQNLQTGVDQLRLYLVRGPFNQGVPTNLAEILAGELEEYSESLSSALNGIRRSIDSVQLGPRLAG